MSILHSAVFFCCWHHHLLRLHLPSLRVTYATRYCDYYTLLYKCCCMCCSLATATALLLLHDRHCLHTIVTPLLLQLMLLH